MNEIERPHSKELLGRANQRHVLSDESRAALESGSINLAIEAGLKGSQTPTKPGRITLVTMVPDDSISIFTVGENDPLPPRITDKSRSIVAGHDELLQGMIDGQDSHRAMLHTRYLNGNVLNPFMPLANCRKMRDSSYFPNGGGTPLYGETLVTLGIVLAKTEEMARYGAVARSATLIITDGLPTDYTDDGKRKLASVIKDMQDSGVHIIAGMGIGQVGVFTNTFKSMGIPADLIYSADSRNEILEAFRMFGKAMLMLTSGSNSVSSSGRVFVV